MGERTVKGSHIIQAREWVDRNLGPGTFKDLTRRGGDRWGLIVPVAWYEVDVLNEALVEASDRLGVPVGTMSAEIARLNAEKDLTSIYRVFLRIAQPQRVLVHTPRLWRTYVSFAEAHAVENEKGHYVGQGDGLSKELVEWACGCWLGFIPTAIELAGGKNARGSIRKTWRDPIGTYSLQLEVIYH